jgi:hypothetical protein
MKTLSSVLKIALGLLALAIVVAPLSLKAQEATKEKKPSKETLEKYDANKDGQLDGAEKAAWKADIAAKAKQTKEANLAKYDVNKNGKLDDEEKAQMKADEAAEKETRKAEKEAKKAAKDAGK